MEKRNGKLWRQMYYYDDKIKGYRKSKFPHLVGAKIIGEKNIQPTPKMPAPQAQVRRVQAQPLPPRPPMQQPTQPQPGQPQRYRIGGSRVSDALIDEYSRLGRR